MKRLLSTVLAAGFTSLLMGCGAAGQVQNADTLKRLDQARASAAGSQAKVPQAHAEAEALYQASAEKRKQGDEITADLLAERARAKYARASLLARKADAEARAMQAEADLSKEAATLAPLEAQAGASADKVKALEGSLSVLGGLGAPAATLPQAGRNAARSEHTRRLLSSAAPTAAPAGPPTTSAVPTALPSALAAPTDDSKVPNFAAIESKLGNDPAQVAQAVDEATGARATCLSKLTIARRKGGALDESDALLEQLSQMKLTAKIFRDERGVVLRLSETDLTSALGQLANVKKSKGFLPVQVTLYPGVKDAAGAQTQVQNAFGKDTKVAQSPGAGAENALGNVEIALITR
jgi:hypothetical protein